MGPASNLHFRNNLILGQGAWPELFSVETFTPWSTSDFNGFGAAVSGPPPVSPGRPRPARGFQRARRTPASARFPP